MGCIIVLLVAFAVLDSVNSAFQVQPLNSLFDDFMDSINTNTSSWKAGRNFHEDIIDTYIRRLMGVKPESAKYTLAPRALHSRRKIPEKFDAREQWPQCITLQAIRDQGSCGSCWALAAASVMSDRVCIRSKGKLNFHFSTENLLACCKTCGNGCDGGVPGAAWEYWVKTGIVSGGPYGSKEGCQSYKIKPCDHTGKKSRVECKDDTTTPSCVSQCDAGFKRSYKSDLVRGSETYSLKQDVQEIQLEIMGNGPVEASYTVYEDFIFYKSGVYQHVKGSDMGGHAIKIIGWGEEKGVPYWLAANSWSYDWGDNGFFKILRGKNHCGIEEKVVAGIPGDKL